jgi:hypothetical protein
MKTTDTITFAVAVNNELLFGTHFLASPCFLGDHGHQILVQKNFSSATKAYNDAIDRARNDLIVLCHQDMFLPEAWLNQLQNAIRQLETLDPNWGVIGPGGITRDGQGQGHLYSSGLGVIGTPFPEPMRVQTLDEIVLVLRKSSGLRFDDHLPHFHLYGTDICLQAAKRDMNCYAISAFCIHNTVQCLVLPPEFYESCNYMRRVWKDYLPIRTTCTELTRFGVPLYWRRLREAYFRYVKRRNEIVGPRAKDVQQLAEQTCGKV